MSEVQDFTKNKTVFNRLKKMSGKLSSYFLSSIGMSKHPEIANPIDKKDQQLSHKLPPISKHNSENGAKTNLFDTKIKRRTSDIVSSSSSSTKRSSSSKRATILGTASILSPSVNVATGRKERPEINYSRGASFNGYNAYDNAPSSLSMASLTIRNDSMTPARLTSTSEKITSTLSNSTSTTTSSLPTSSSSKSSVLCCDKCDGKHETDDCPYYKKKRDDHPDAQKNGWKMGKTSSLPHAMVFVLPVYFM